MNRFIAGHQVLNTHREFVQNGSSSFWTFCVEYLDSPGKNGREAGKNRRRDRVDYKEVLSPADFAVFSRLREARKQMARAEAVPAYAVCTDEQLANMARVKELTAAELKKVDGFGDAKFAKYGQGLIAAHVGQMVKEPKQEPGS